MLPGEIRAGELGLVVEHTESAKPHDFVSPESRRGKSEETIITYNPERPGPNTIRVTKKRAESVQQRTITLTDKVGRSARSQGGTIIVSRNQRNSYRQRAESRTTEPRKLHSHRAARETVKSENEK